MYVIERAFDRMSNKPTTWGVEFDDAWLIHNGTTVALREHGYSLGSATQVNKQTGEARLAYWIANVRDTDDTKSNIIFETTDQDELNRYINLILPPRS